MRSRLLATIWTAAGFTAAYYVYALLVSPLLAPADMQRQRPVYSVQNEPPPTVSRENAAKWLPDQPWAAKDPNEFANGDVTIYSGKFEPVEDNKAVRFEPFAMIWFQEEGEQPITMVADAAVIRFSKAFDQRTGSIGRPVYGEFIRRAEIRGPDGLWIKGRNFVFQESAMHIVTDNVVQFWYGPHQGRSLGGMELNLLPSRTARDENDLAVGGIESVRLLRDVEMNIVQEGENAADPVTISSSGSFIYTFESATATFEDQVHIVRPTGPGMNDTVDCDKLTVAFDTRPPDGAPPPAPKTGGFDVRAPHDVLWVKAEGRNVTLHSDENNLTAEKIAELLYDKVRQNAVLRGGNVVDVRQAGSRLRSPEIVLYHDAGGKLTSSWCRGHGTLEHDDLETGERQLDASWNEHLKMFPDPQNPALDVVEFSRDVKLIQRSRNSALSAELIRIWVKRAEDGGNPLASGGGLQGNSGKIVPQRLVARENVALVSPELDGETKQLGMWFEQGRLPETIGVGAAAPNKQQAPAARTASLSTPSTGSAGAAVVPVATDAGAAEKTPPKEPYVVSADMIRVKVLQPPEGGESQVQSVWADGNVDIRQEHPAPEQPMHLIGERIRLENRGSNDQHLVLFGSPAWIEDRQANITGGEIHFDRQRNIIEIRGKGVLQLPVRNDMDGKALERPSTLDVRWQDKMEFDGRTALFYGDVEAVLFDNQTRRQNNRMTCEEMHVTLTERISFTEKSAEQGEVDVQNIFCLDGVNYHGFEYEGDRFVGSRKAEFFELSVSPVTGETFARGGGTLLFWQHGQGKNPALAPSTVVRANRPLKSDTVEWSYTRVRFAGRMDGNLNQERVTFRDQVEVVHGPVEHPQETIDEENLPNGAGWMRSDVLHLFQRGPEDEKFVELQAIGNARIQGNAVVPENDREAASPPTGSNFEAQSEEITYDSAKQLFTLRSQGSPLGMIRYQKTKGGVPSDHNFKSALFNPATQYLEVDGSTILRGIE